MTLACHKAAKKVLMEYMEDTRGLGWWGNNDFKDYYKNLETDDNPLSYIKVIPLLSAEAQRKCGGFDHAGKFETSLVYALYPESVDLERTRYNTEWFAESAKEANINELSSSIRRNSPKQYTELQERANRHVELDDEYNTRDINKEAMKALDL